MPTITNKTQKPLSVPLPGGKTLHLSPGKTGQISARATEAASLRALIEAGEVEVGDDAPSSGDPRSGKPRRASFYGPTSRGGARRSGDR